MNVGNTLFAQGLELLQWKTFGRIIASMQGRSGSASRPRVLVAIIKKELNLDAPLYMSTDSIGLDL